MDQLLYITVRELFIRTVTCLQVKSNMSKNLENMRKTLHKSFQKPSGAISSPNHLVDQSLLGIKMGVKVDNFKVFEVYKVMIFMIQS